MRNYKDLEIHGKAREIVVLVYNITETFPKSELFSITNQIRRSAVSVVANIVEGSSRDSNKEFRNFLNISIGSISELEVLLDISKDLKYFSENNSHDLYEKINHLRRMLINFKKSIKL